MKDTSSWEQFKVDWYTRLKKVENALKLVNLYPERLPLVYFGNLLSYDQLESSQRDWISLWNRLHTEDKEYFKPYFVPINSDSFEIFIDLSNEKLPLYHFMFRPITKKWFHHTRFESILELLIYLDSDTEVPPLRDKEFAKIINTKLKELDIDQIIEDFNKRKKDRY